MLPDRQVKGFVLLHKPESLLDRYERSDMAQQNAEHLARIRNAVSLIKPSEYRGIAREPLMPWSSIDEELLRTERSVLIDLKKEQRARKRFLQMSGEDREQWDFYIDGWDYNKALLADLEMAKGLHAVLNVPGDYEIVEVRRDVCDTDYEFLGFDVGYWRNDNFSLICDTIVMPHWHPPSDEVLAESAGRLCSLNEHVLFSTIEEAEAFREYYRSSEWGETENPIGEFCIIQIALP